MAENTSYAPCPPPEVLREIAQYLSSSPADLLPLSLASCMLRDVAQSILFCHPTRIILQQAQEEAKIQAKFPDPDLMFRLFIDTILSSPDRLGPLVRSYTHQRPDEAPYDREYYSKINSALRSMTSLKRLAFSGQGLPSSILFGCTFQLNAFHWENKESAMGILRDFLPTQKSLTHLTLPFDNGFASEETIALAESVCPRLESLTGTRDTIDLFVKGRKVTYLRWDTNGTPTNEFRTGPPPASESFDTPGNGLAEIQYLTFIPSFSSRLPSELLKNLESLVLLETPKKAIEGNDDLVLLSNLPALRVLIIRDGTFFSNIAPLDFVREILTCCPHLLHVDIEISPGVYKRFTQQSLASGFMEGFFLSETSHLDPHSSSYVHAFTSISAFDGIDRLLTPVDYHPALFEVMTLKYNRNMGGGQSRVLELYDM